MGISSGPALCDWCPHHYRGALAGACRLTRCVKAIMPRHPFTRLHSEQTRELAEAREAAVVLAEHCGCQPSWMPCYDRGCAKDLLPAECDAHRVKAAIAEARKRMGGEG